jgi:drug/metabolite transporter (DMT)-like permease
MAFLMALGSLFFAVLNDVMFKLYARKSRPRGLYVGVIGLVWCTVFGVAGHLTSGLQFDPVTLKWGLIAGAFGAASNLMLIHCLTHLDIGLSATIYRLNMAPAAILAFIFLGEQVTVWKVAGILCAAAAVLLFMPRRPAAGHAPATHRHHGRLFWMIVAASLLRAGMGLAYKAGMGAGADRNSFLLINGGVWAIAGVLFFVLLEQRTEASHLKTLGYGTGSGVLVCGIVFFMAAAMKLGDASLVLPVSQLSFLGSALIGVILLGEKLLRRGMASLALGLLCIIMMAVDAYKP